MNIIDYCVIEDISISAFQEEVKGLIAYGWQPLGGVSSSFEDVGSDGKVTVYRQAMVKYGDGLE